MQDHQLYTGTLDNPKQTVIATGVYNALCSFEDPPFLVAPNWSKDQRYVGYFTKDGYYIKDTQTNQAYKANTTKVADETGACGDSVDINVIGWDNNNNFYFATNQGQTVYQMVLPTGEQSKFENLYAGPGTTLTQISPDGRYFVYAPAPATASRNFRASFTINNAGKDGSRVCNNEFGFSEGPVSNAERSWSKLESGVVVISTTLPQGYVLTSFDVQRCTVLANVIVPDTYGPDGLYYAGVQ